MHVRSRQYGSIASVLQVEEVVNKVPAMHPFYISLAPG